MEEGGRRSPPRLHVVTDDSVLARAGFEAMATAVIQAGGAALAFHLRGPRMDGAALYALANRLLPETRRVGGTFLVNDRVDVALVAATEGVHLGARSLPVAAARAMLPAGRWVGASCRDAAGASAARRDGADYVFVGTIYSTPSHPGVPGLGAEGLGAMVVRLPGFPLIGIGGVDAARVGELMSAGAHGVAVVRGAWDARDPAKAVLRYAEEIAKGVRA